MDKIEFLDQNILDRLYTPTLTGETLTFEDFLKLPVNDEYFKNKLKSNSINIITTPTKEDDVNLSKE